MSNLERDPVELEGECGPFRDGDFASVTVLPARDVPLGGPRAMNVRRTLPSRGRSMIGAWCFLDHYGPTDVTTAEGMRVPPHPHTGLQTVSWLFSGEIEHRDSVGSHAFVEPGTLNLMTAGRGISHSEVSTTDTTILHGVQLWLALPDSDRHIDPFFEATTASRIACGDALLTVFIGELAGGRARSTVFSPVVAAQIDIPAGACIDLPVDSAYEYGILVDSGDVTVNAQTVPRSELAYLEPGSTVIRIAAGDDAARLVLIGGEPFGERIVMWWNFVGRSHNEIVEYRSAWQAEALSVGAVDGPARFTSVQAGTGHSYEGAPLPAPELPTVRLMPRA